MKHKLYNRLLSLALVLGLVAGMLPGVTFAGAVDSDATALQSQVEQIAEPTEEPEANDAPQVEPRVGWGESEGTFYVQHVDENGNQIGKQSTETIGYNGYNTNGTSVDSYVGTISNYEYQYATINGNQVTRIRVSRWGAMGLYNYFLQYYSDDWYEVGENFILTLHYRNTAEPEPTPDPTPEPSGDVYISDSILQDGMLNAMVSDELADQVSSYQWYRSETGAENTWEEVERNRVTGTEYNVNTDGTGLNAALDKYFAEPDDDTVRYYYYVEAFDANGSSLGKSDAYQVPYYDALQNGSFETPKANSWNNQLANGTPYLYWKTTGIAPAGKEGQDVEIIRYTDERFEYDSTFAAEVRGAYGNIMKSDGTRGAEDGVQFAELNAEAMGALYQDVLTTPGSTLYWSLAHAARTAGGNNPPDQMQVIIAPAEEVKNITTQSQLLRFIATHPEYVQKPAGSDNEGIIASNQSVWTTYNGTYKVADGQYVTRFFFVSRSAGGEGNSLGNLLDDISFSRNIPEPDEDTGNLEVTKQVVGMDEIPDDYKVVIKVENEHYSIHEEYTFTKSSFTWDSAEQVWKASYVFQNLPVDTNDTRYYSVTEKVSGYSTDDFEFQKDESTTSQNVQVQAGQTVSAELKNVYLQDTSDEYPVRFYLQDVNGNEMYNFEDDWGILPSYLQSGFANVATSETPASDYVTTNIQGHDAVQNWIKTNGYDPGINMNDVGTVLQNLINQGYITRGTQVATINGDSVTANEIINNSSDYSIVYVQATNNNDKLNKDGYKRGNVTYDNEGYPWQKSYHVHLSIRKNPGDLTVTKTFAGLEADQIPSEFAIQVRASNGTLIDTLSLNEATLKDDTYTWTLENLNEDTYTVTETGTDVENMVLSATMKVTDEDVQTQETVEDTTAQVKVANNKTSTVDITNTYSPADGYLTIKKEISGTPFGDGRDTFNFKVTAISGKDAGKVWYFTINGEGETKAIKLPVGEYTIEELSNINYTCDADSQTVTISNSNTETSPVTVTFTNTPSKTKIPTDSGGVKNVAEIKEGQITWKQEPENDEKPTPEPTHD